MKLGGASALREPVSDYSQAIARLCFIYITMSDDAARACRELVADIFWVSDSKVVKDLRRALKELRDR